MTRQFGGEGDPVVAVHGLGGSLLNWVPVAPFLAGLGQVSAFDLPGFGYSPPRAESSIRSHVATTIDYLERVGGNSLLIGNSMGGLVSMLAAGKRPDLVRGLVLLCPAAPPTLRDPTIDREVAKRLVLQGVPLVGEAFVRRYWTESSAAQQIRDTLTVVCHHPERIPPEVWEEALTLTEARRRQPWAVKALVRSGRSTGAHIARPDRYFSAARAVEAPTLLITGAHDRVVPGSGTARLAKARPEWSYTVMADVGHCPQLEAPAEFADLVLTWWKGQNRSELTSPQ